MKMHRNLEIPKCSDIFIFEVKAHDTTLGLGTHVCKGWKQPQPQRLIP